MKSILKSKLTLKKHTLLHSAALKITGSLPDKASDKKLGLLQNLWVKIRVKSPKYQLG